jgi:hypothetical protein
MELINSSDGNSRNSHVKKHLKTRDPNNKWKSEWYRKFLIGYTIKLSHVYNYTLNNEEINTAAEVDYKNVSFKVRHVKLLLLQATHTKAHIHLLYYLHIWGNVISWEFHHSKRSWFPWGIAENCYCMGKTAPKKPLYICITWDYKTVQRKT